MLSKLVWGLCMLHSLAVCLHTSARPEPYGLSTSPRDISGRAVADDDGDLAPGERVSGPFCEIGSSAPTRRDFEEAGIVPIRAPRAPSEKSPLDEPENGSSEAFAKFIEKFDNDDYSEYLEISPLEEQTENWKIELGRTWTPIGATGIWNTFGSTKQNFRMQGLHGCTAIIAVSSQGLYAGHLWEGAKHVNGPSSFLRRYTEGKKGDVRPRPVRDFQRIAVDIFGEATPEADRSSRPDWISLKDLQERYGDPFQDGRNVYTFFLTPAMSAKSSKQKYEPQISRLRRKFAELIPDSNHKEETYIADNGALALIAVQYSPYDHDKTENGCTIPQARVRVFYENHQEAIIDRSWDATDSQVNRRRRRDACLVGTGVANTTGTGVANTAGTGVANTAGTGQVTNTAGTAGNTGTAASLPITTGAGPYQNTTRSSLAQPTTTAAQSVSCSYQDATPENPAACTCVSGSSTTIVQPMVIASVEMITQSCAYSTWPITQAAVTTPPPIVSTNFPGCQVCTVIGPNEDDCSPLPSSLGCTVASTSTILSGDTQGVTVGALTGSALYSAITSGIDQVCQVPVNSGAVTGSFTCTETATATLATDIRYTAAALGQTDWSTEGDLTLQITEASYDSLEWYASNKEIIALYAQNSTQNNCQSMTAYGVPSVSERDVGPAIQDPIEETYTICKAGSNYQLIEVDPSNNGPARELSFSLKFEAAPVSDLICTFMEDVIEFIETAVSAETDTEGALPEEIKLDQKALDACQSALGG